jgi:hypothetical protein
MTIAQMASGKRFIEYFLSQRHIGHGRCAVDTSLSVVNTTLHQALQVGYPLHRSVRIGHLAEWSDDARMEQTIAGD